MPVCYIQVLGLGFKGYKRLIFVVFQHDRWIDRLYPLDKLACRHYGCEIIIECGVRAY